MATALLEDLENLLTDARGADRIEEDFDADAALGRFGEGLGERQADLAGPVDVRLDCDRVRGGPDRVKHRGIELVAVVEQRQLVAALERNAGRAGQRVEKINRADLE